VPEGVHVPENGARKQAGGNIELSYANAEAQKVNGVETSTI
jgi:hypothetical protein